MLRIARRLLQGIPTDVLSLPYTERKKSRLRTRTDGGCEVAISLQRGSMLRDGDLLAADSGEIVLIRAAVELVSQATPHQGHDDGDGRDARLLARAAYHLGNRHVALQIETNALRYQHDHVLDTLLRDLGLYVTAHTAAFEPERGAYVTHAIMSRGTLKTLAHVTDHKH